MLGHELTHIRNGDVQLMVVAVIIAGVVGFAAELFFRIFTNLSWSYPAAAGRPRHRVLLFVLILRPRWEGLNRRRRRHQRPGRGGADRSRVAAVPGCPFALSRSREFLADAGSVELTKNPDA